MADILDGIDEGDYAPAEPPAKGGCFYKDTPDISGFESAKAFYARILVDYAEGRLPRDRARTLGYLLAGYLSYFRQETDQEILSRLEAVEERLEERGRV